MRPLQGQARPDQVDAAGGQRQPVHVRTDGVMLRPAAREHAGKRTLRPARLRQARPCGVQHGRGNIERTQVSLGIACPQMRQPITGAGAHIEHARRLQRHEIEPLEQAVAHFALQHRVGVVAGGGMIERPPHLGEIQFGFSHGQTVLSRPPPLRHATDAAHGPHGPARCAARAAGSGPARRPPPPG